MIISIILASLGLRAFLYLGPHWTKDPWKYRFFPTELALFLFGTLAYKLYLKIEPLNLPKSLPVAPGLLVFTAIFIHPLLPLTSFTRYNLVNWALYGFAILAIPFILKWSKASRFDAVIGAFSYPIYITQFIGIDMALHLLKGTSTEPLVQLFVIFGCVALAWLTNKIVAEPIERLRKQRASQVD